MERFLFTAVIEFHTSYSFISFSFIPTSSFLFSFLFLLLSLHFLTYLVFHSSAPLCPPLPFPPCSTLCFLDCHHSSALSRQETEQRLSRITNKKKVTSISYGAYISEHEGAWSQFREESWTQSMGFCWNCSFPRSPQVSVWGGEYKAVTSSGTSNSFLRGH